MTTDLNQACKEYCGVEHECVFSTLLTFKSGLTVQNKNKQKYFECRQNKMFEIIANLQI